MVRILLSLSLLVGGEALGASYFTTSVEIVDPQEVLFNISYDKNLSINFLKPNLLQKVLDHQTCFVKNNSLCLLEISGEWFAMTILPKKNSAYNASIIKLERSFLRKSLKKWHKDFLDKRKNVATSNIINSRWTRGNNASFLFKSGLQGRVVVFEDSDFGLLDESIELTQYLFNLPPKQAFLDIKKISKTSVSYFLQKWLSFSQNRKAKQKTALIHGELKKINHRVQEMILTLD